MSADRLSAAGKAILESSCVLHMEIVDERQHDKRPVSRWPVLPYEGYVPTTTQLYAKFCMYLRSLDLGQARLSFTIPWQQHTELQALMQSAISPLFLLRNIGSVRFEDLMHMKTFCRISECMMGQGTTPAQYQNLIYALREQAKMHQRQAAQLGSNSLSRHTRILLAQLYYYEAYCTALDYLGDGIRLEWPINTVPLHTATMSLAFEVMNDCLELKISMLEEEKIRPCFSKSRQAWFEDLKSAFSISANSREWPGISNATRAKMHALRGRLFQLYSGFISHTENAAYARKKAPIELRQYDALDALVKAREEYGFAFDADRQVALALGVMAHSSQIKPRLYGKGMLSQARLVRINLGPVRGIWWGDADLLRQWGGSHIMVLLNAIDIKGGIVAKKDIRKIRAELDIHWETNESMDNMLRLLTAL